MNEIEEYILRQDEEQRHIMLYLHDLFTDRYKLKPKIRYGIPFYDRRVWLCYINPIKNGGVDLTFLKGRQMLDRFEQLEGRNRKMVSSLVIKRLNEVDEILLKELLDAAIQLDRGVL